MESAWLIDRYARLCVSADRHADDGWRSLNEDGMKRRYAMDPETLDRFADYVFGGIGFEVLRDFLGATPSIDGVILKRPQPTAEQRRSHATAAAGLLKNALEYFHRNRIAPEEWGPLLTADNVVGGMLMKVPVEGRSIVVSSHTLAVATRAPEMRMALGAIPPSVLEIGGGHGRFVRDVLKLSPGSRITYCDLPFNLLLAARYLSRVFPGQVHLAWNGDDVPDTARITLVPPWRLAEIPYSIDVCCNFLSFQHMHRENLAFYGTALARLGVGTIYHVNRLTPLHPQEIALDDYPFRDLYRTISRRVVSRADFYRHVDGQRQRLGSGERVEEVLRLA